MNNRKPIQNKGFKNRNKQQCLVENRLRSFISELDEQSREFYRYTFGLDLSYGARGHFARSALLLLLVEERKEIIDIAAAIEIIHHASLIVDDVIDGAAIRRGRRSFFLKFGRAPATLFPHKMLIHARKIILDSQSPENLKILQLLYNVIEGMIDGELRDISRLRMNKNKAQSYTDYSVTVTKKTGELYGAIASISVLLSKDLVPTTSQKQFCDLFIEVGVGHQVYDDLSDASKNIGEGVFLTESYARKNYDKSILNVENFESHIGQYNLRKKILIELILGMIGEHRNKDKIKNLLSHIYG